MAPASPPEQARLQTLLVGRAWPDEPKQLGEDEDHWRSSWRMRKSASKTRLLSEKTAGALPNKSVAAVARNDQSEYGPSMPRSVDGDSGYDARSCVGRPIDDPR